MVRLLLVICLAALIGNPLCCCAFAGPVSALPLVESFEELPPCCRARALAENRRPTSTPDEPHEPSCPCAKRAGFVPAEKLLVPTPTSSAPAILAPSGITSPLRGAIPRFASIQVSVRPTTGVSPPLYLLHRALLC